VDEEGWRPQAGKMLGALLFWLPRRMQRVGKQQKTRDQVGRFGAKHAGLTSAVRMSAEEDPARYLTGELGNRIFQPGSVAGGVAGAGRTK